MAIADYQCWKQGNTRGNGRRNRGVNEGRGTKREGGQVREKWGRQAEL